MTVVNFLKAKDYSRSFVNELVFVVGITIAWVSLIALALTRMTGIVFVVFVICGLGPLWDAICTDDRTLDRPRIRNGMTWLLCLSVVEYLIFYSLHMDYGHEIPYFGVMPILMVLLTLHTIWSVHKDHVATLRSARPADLSQLPVAQVPSFDSTQTAAIEQEPIRVPSAASQTRTVGKQGDTGTGQTKSWQQIAGDLWKYQPLKEQYTELVEAIKDSLWPGTEVKVSTVFFDGFLGDIKRLNLRVPNDTNRLESVFIEIARDLLGQHGLDPFTDVDDFIDAREELLTAKFG